MKLANRSNRFTINDAKKSSVSTKFQAHFGREPKTTFSNISTTPKSSNLSYENILYHYLDADTVPAEDYLVDNGRVTEERSEILIEEAMSRAQVDAGRRQNGEMNKAVSRFVFHPRLTNPIPRSQKLLELNLCRKNAKESKRDLRGLWETLAPGSTDVRISPSTTVIKERGTTELKVRNSDIAKIGTKAERNTDLRKYAQRRVLPYDKTIEKKDRIPLEIAPFSKLLRT